MCKQFIIYKNNNSGYETEFRSYDFIQIDIVNSWKSQSRNRAFFLRQIINMIKPKQYDQIRPISLFY